MAITIRLRRDSTQAWAFKNPILALGEPGVEVVDGSTRRLKIGNGVTPWNDLGYIDNGSGGSGGSGGGAQQDTLITNGSVSGVYSLSVSAATVHDIVLVGQTSFTFPFTTSGVKYLTLIARQDEAGGHTLTWPSTVAWSGGSEPSIPQHPNAISILTFMTVDGGNNWFGFVSGEDMKSNGAM